MKDINPDSMRIVLDYVYTGGKEIKIEEDNVESLLQASNHLQFYDIKLLCVDFLLKHIETSNCLQVLELADVYNCESMAKTVGKFIGKHFVEITKNQLTASKETMLQLLSNQQIEADEKEVFQALMNWVENDLDKRVSFLLDLLKHIRMGAMTKKYINFTLIPFLKRFLQCQDFLVEIMSFHLLDKEHKKGHKLQSLMYREGQDKSLLLLSRNFCLEYDFEERKWYKQMQLPLKEKELPGDIFYHSEGLYYISSGTKYDNDDDNSFFEGRTDILVWRYDSATKVWKEIQNSKIDGEERPIYFTQSGSKIIAIGGESSQEVPSDKVSVFDLNHTDQGWRRIASLNRADVYFKLVTHEGVMYAFSSEEKYYEYYDESLL